MKARFQELRNHLGNMDPISNAINQIKNAGNAGHEKVVVPFSKLKLGIMEVLKKEGFIKGFEERVVKGKKSLVVEVVFEDAKREKTGRPLPKINGVKRVSKPSKRIYKKASEIRPIKNGYGSIVLSTSLGIMSGREAKKAGLGGEALFIIW